MSQHKSKRPVFNPPIKQEEVSASTPTSNKSLKEEDRKYVKTAEKQRGVKTELKSVKRKKKGDSHNKIWKLCVLSCIKGLMFYISTVVTLA